MNGEYISTNRMLRKHGGGVLLAGKYSTDENNIATKFAF